MRIPRSSKFVAIGLLLLLGPADCGLADEIDFNRDIRPILADKCFACHGPDAHALQGGLRLGLFGSVTSPSDSGRTAIVPGQPARSELFLRITSDDAEEIMPPPDSHQTLDEAEKKLLGTAIGGGSETCGGRQCQESTQRSTPDDGRHQGTLWLVVSSHDA